MLNGGDRHDVVPARVQSRRLAVDRHRLAGRRRLEQEAKAGIAQQMPVEAAFERQPASEHRQIEVPAQHLAQPLHDLEGVAQEVALHGRQFAGLTRLVEALSAIWASSRSVIR